MAMGMHLYGKALSGYRTHLIRRQQLEESAPKKRFEIYGQVLGDAMENLGLRLSVEPIRVHMLLYLDMCLLPSTPANKVDMCLPEIGPGTPLLMAALPQDVSEGNTEHRVSSLHIVGCEIKRRWEAGLAEYWGCHSQKIIVSIIHCYYN